jgi:hypothetical protein
MVNAVPGGRSAVLTQATAIMPSVASTQLTSETVLALKAVHVLVPLDVLSDTPKIHDRKNWGVIETVPAALPGEPTTLLAVAPFCTGLAPYISRMSANIPPPVLNPV